MTEPAQAPVGLVRTPGDATQFLDEMCESVEQAQPIIEAFEGHELTKAELEFELALCAALRRQATIELHPHGIRVQKWLPDGQGLGYAITARDRQGRRYEVAFRYETFDRPDSLNKGELGRAVLDEVIKGVLNARNGYINRRDAAEAAVKARVIR